MFDAKMIHAIATQPLYQFSTVSGLIRAEVVRYLSSTSDPLIILILNNPVTMFVCEYHIIYVQYAFNICVT